MKKAKEIKHERRLGKIKISDEFVRDKPLDLCPFFMNFIPVHIESRPHMRDFVYTGYSPDFDKIEEAVPIPFYSAKLTTNKHGKIIYVEFERENL